MAYETILVPLDHAGCASAVAEHAAALARPLGAQVVLLAVVHPPAGVHLDDPTAAGEVAAVLDHEAGDALAALQRDLAAQGVNARVEVRHGDVVRTILATADEIGANLVVMGTHGRTGLRRLLLGSVAEAVLRESHVPVLVVRAPEGTPDRPSDAWERVAAESAG